ncbi:MAG: hypothetical protein HY744_01555 [Deltaproteobacteria bacterium]|nr:hypothetical protein [Deltaproteobacteria bacterium]
MEEFLARYRSLVTGVLSGFDRIVFRGSLQPLLWKYGIQTFLSKVSVRGAEFKQYALRTSERVKDAALTEALQQGRPIRYLPSSTDSKEDLARAVLAEQPTEQGIVCAFSVVEPCMSFVFCRPSDANERALQLRPRKCLHVYQYRIHPRFGFMNARIQTWFPFNVQVCVNGREWLARRLVELGVAHRRHDNTLLWVADVARAQHLLDDQLDTEWPAVLEQVARLVNPLHDEIFALWPMSYYWTAYQSEWATDLMFRDPAALASLYPPLVRHALLHFRSPDLMRFLARKAHGNFTGPLGTDFKDRAEALRVKHWANGNSIKMYDKAGSVLRVETTLGNPNDFLVFRPAHDEPDGKLAWRPIRKGVADLHRRAQVCQRSNERYLDALSVVDDSTPLATLLDQVARPTTWREKRVRALRTGDPADVALLAAVSRGEFATAGFRNRHIRLLLHPETASADRTEVRRIAARVGRQLRLLRAHGLVRKIPKTHRYQLTAKGHALTAALSAARSATLQQLLRQAA